jgi:DNA-binding transcriptional ArsR family regulator/rhodanese-related sulfurtransferase
MLVNKQLQDLKTKQDEIFFRSSQILKTLAAPVRIRLIHFLSQSPLTVEILSQKIDQSISNTSMHLRKLFNENIVGIETIGQKRLYSLHPAMLEFWESSQNFIQKIDSSLHLDESLNWESSLDGTIENQHICFLDVRPDDEVNLNLFIPPKNYIHISYHDLKKNLFRIPKNKKILVVCRGRMCALSAYSVIFLRENNINAYRLDKSWFALGQTIFQKDFL